MAERKNVARRVNSAEVQGEGSYVVLTPITVGEATERFALLALVVAGVATPEQSIRLRDIDLTLCRSHVQDWDWVDGEGNRLPTPVEDPAVVDRLVNEEERFILDALFDRTAARKNS